MAGDSGRGWARERFLRLFLQVRGEILCLCFGAVDGGVGDLFAALDCFGGGLFNSVDDLVGRLSHCLVLDPCRGKQQSGYESDRDAADGEPQGVAFSGVFQPADFSPLGSTFDAVPRLRLLPRSASR